MTSTADLLTTGKIDHFDNFQSDPIPNFHSFVNLGMTINNGERESAGRAFLVNPISTLPNFYFMRNATVTKVLATKDAATGTVLVTGVTVVTNNTACKTFNVKASREVIISAGSYGSPQILQRSGIGKAADLAACGIAQLKELPVGSNLNDHADVMSYFKMPGSVTATIAAALLYYTNQGLSYVNSGRIGYFSHFGAASYSGFVNVTSRTATHPDVQYITGKYEQNMADINITINDKFGYKPAFAEQLIAYNKNYTLIQVMTIVLNPKSRGSVRYRSCTDPYASPIINGNYLSHPDDLAIMLKGMKNLCEIFNTPAMINAGVTPVIFDIPECAGLTFCSDAYNTCYSKYFSSNMWHPTSTCKMGTSATDSVVDSKLQVFGVKRGLSTTRTNPMLRVADASIMPFVTSGNTQCPTYTIGEKAAAMIIADNP
jgi:choline dehydrogenase